MNENLTSPLEILIVDDDRGVRELLCQLLSEQYQCRVASSAIEALDLIGFTSPAVVIVDVSMPGMSGLDLVPLILKNYRDTVVMMISGDQTIDNAIAAIRAGAFDFIKKPFDLDHVELAVARAINHHLLLTEKRRHDEQLEALVEERSNKLNFLAYYDELTGLPKRNRFESQIDDLIAKASETDGIAVLVAAPDRFLDMRDTLGHAIGEQILKTFAGRLEAAVGKGSIVGRLDAAEFGVAITGIEDASDVIPVIHRIFSSLSGTFRFPSHDIFVSAAVGVSWHPKDADDANTLINNAGVALSQARSQGKMNFEFFTRDMHDKALRTLTLGNELRQAVDEGQFEVYYQPKIDTRRHKIVGLEALLRWRHPRLGFVSPADFIPIAEETGLITQIGKWILAETCSQLKKWQELGFELYAAVNVSPVQFDRNLARIVSEILEETQLEARYLNLEVTESSIMENAELTIDTLNQLREMGVKVSIDDFGTGYSSLAILKSLPVDVLKIDRSFIKEVNTNEDDASLVMSIISQLAANRRRRGGRERLTAPAAQIAAVR